MTAAIIIPARLGSSRFPRKPLAKISGLTVIERVWRIAMAVRNCSQVFIATEDAEISDHAKSFGARVIEVKEKCRNGTERVGLALKESDFTGDIIVNFQGDAVLTPPWVLEATIDAMIADASIGIATPALSLDVAAAKALIAWKQNAATARSGTTVVFDPNGDALYFSKAVIPNAKKLEAGVIHRHIGLYGFRRASLERYCELAQTQLEQVEDLEQLRALENGMPIRVIIVDYRGRTHASIDALEDITAVEAVIEREGELLGALGNL